MPPSRAAAAPAAPAARDAPEESAPPAAPADYRRKEPVRFDSFRFRTFRKSIGSVRCGSENVVSRFDAVRPSFFGRVLAQSGSVRFLPLVPAGSGRFGSVGSVRFCLAGSVRFLIPSCYRSFRLRRADDGEFARAHPTEVFRGRRGVRLLRGLIILFQENCQNITFV